MLCNGLRALQGGQPEICIRKYDFFRYFFLSWFILAFTSLDAVSKPYKLDVSGNRVSADFENMPLSSVIDDIGAKTGIKFLFAFARIPCSLSERSVDPDKSGLRGASFNYG